MTITVTLVAQSPCFTCGYRYRVVRVSTVRVNKNSLKEQGVSLVFVGPRGTKGLRPLPAGCPECGSHDRCHLYPVSPFRLDPVDAAKIAEYRDRKWPT